MFKPRTLALVVLIAVLLTTLVSTVLAQGAATVQVTDNPTYGQILTDGSGKTLYMFTSDTPGVSNCSDNCATAWPPLTVSTGVTPTLASGVTGTLTTLTRADNTVQVVFNDMPLYYFAQDTAAGDTKGQGVGEKWYVINPATGPNKTVPVAAATAEATAPAAAAAAATPAAGATAAATAAAPAQLPTTGGNGSSTLLILGAAGLALVGLALFTFRGARSTR